MTPEKHRARRETLEAACHTTWYQVSLTQGLKLEKSTQKEKGSLSVLHEATTGLGDAHLNTESNLFLIKASRYQHLLSLYLQYLTHVLYCFLLCPFSGPPYFQQAGNSTHTAIILIFRLVFPICIPLQSKELGRCGVWPQQGLACPSYLPLNEREGQAVSVLTQRKSKCAPIHAVRTLGLSSGKAPNGM